MEGSGWKGPAIFLLPHDKKFEFNVKTMQCFQVPKSQDSDGFWQGSSQIPDPRDSQGLLKTGCPAAWLTAFVKHNEGERAFRQFFKRSTAT